MIVIKKLVSVDPADAYFDISRDLIGLSFDVSYMYLISNGMRGPASCIDKIPAVLSERPELKISQHGFYFLCAKFE